MMMFYDQATVCKLGDCLSMQHLALIPDGNRRWAQAHKRESLYGHQKGKETVKLAIQVCLRNKISYLSVYTFSQENLRRSAYEKSYLFSMLEEGFKQDSALFQEHGVKISFLGDLTLFPEKTQTVMRMLEEQTKANKNLQLNLLVGYSGRNEIAHAVRSLVQDVQAGKLALDAIDEQIVGDRLFTAGMPDPDLIIRTGGAVRLSNFLLYQAAYSECMFLDCFWPDLTEQALQSCIDNFKTIKRNFGA